MSGRVRNQRRDQKLDILGHPASRKAEQSRMRPIRNPNSAKNRSTPIVPKPYDSGNRTKAGRS